MYSPLRLVTFVSLALSILLAASASAQSEEAAQAVDAVSTLANMIRWTGLAASLMLISAAWLLLRFVSRLIDQLGNVFGDYRLTFQKVGAFIRFGVYFVTILATILLSLDMSRDVLAILGGTAAVAIGFAMKDLVSSLVSGVMIMFDRPFQVGDRVTFGGQYGDILSIGLRSVKLRTLDDSMVTIPNSMFLNEVTSCGNYGVLNMQIVMDFLIGVDQDAARAQAIVREAGVTSRYVYLPNPLDVLVTQVAVGDYLALRVRLKAYVLDTKYEKAFETDVTLRVLDAFREAAIQPPAVLHRSVDGTNAPVVEPLRAAG